MDCDSSELKGLEGALDKLDDSLQKNLRFGRKYIIVTASLATLLGGIIYTQTIMPKLNTPIYEIYESVKDYLF